MGSSLLNKTRTIAAFARNYVAHARELQNELPKEPFFFLKPVGSIVRHDAERKVIEIPTSAGEVHHEVELAVILGKKSSRVKKADAMNHIAAYALAIDVTGRTLQDKVKSKGHPWTKAKGYDTWCPMSQLVDAKHISDPMDLEIWLKINGEDRQRDRTSLMIFPIPDLIENLTDVMTLEEGDIILTGTPAGVGPMKPEDEIKFGGDGFQETTVQVVERS